MNLWSRPDIPGRALSGAAKARVPSFIDMPVIENSKFEYRNPKQIPIFKFQNGLVLNISILVI
jgi:hypothetical protein